MKLQFKHQKFQADAAKATCDIFAGQPFLTPTYMMDKGKDADAQMRIDFEHDYTGWGNHKLVPELNDHIILENLQKVQHKEDYLFSLKIVQFAKVYHIFYLLL